MYLMDHSHSNAAVSPGKLKGNRKPSKTSIQQCCVYKCTNRSEFGLYRLPNKDELDRRQKWIRTLRLEKVTKNAVVCGKHFETKDFMTPSRNSKGKIRRLRKTAVPSQNLPRCGHSKSLLKRKKIEEQIRDERTARRRLFMDNECTVTSLAFSKRKKRLDHKMQTTSDIEENTSINASSVISGLNNDVSAETINASSTDVITTNMPVQEGALLRREASVQVNTLMNSFDVGAKLINFVSTDARMQACTGISSTNKFETLCESVESWLLRTSENPPSRSDICIRERILLTLMKLKMNLQFSALSALFDISRRSATDIFFSTIDILFGALQHFVYWPSRDSIRDNLPAVFLKDFSKTRVILDCIEISVQQFSCLICKTRTYSPYKCTHTVKVLIGIAPSGLITFVSKSFGGRTSDKFIFTYSKIPEKCEAGDAIMADKRFLIEEECQSAGIELIRPPFVRKKTGKLSSVECAEIKAIARARVHVERITQRIKIFEFLNNQIESRYLESFDKIMTIVCALVNLSEPLFRDESFEI